MELQCYVKKIKKEIPDTDCFICFSCEQISAPIKTAYHGIDLTLYKVHFPQLRNFFSYVTKIKMYEKFAFTNYYDTQALNIIKHTQLQPAEIQFPSEDTQGWS